MNAATREKCVFFFFFTLLLLWPLPGWSQDYVVGPEDVLEVTVHDNDDLNRRVAVSLEGFIGLPLIGKVRAAGLTPRELELRITELFADGYLKKPQVSVFIREYRSQKVFVLGAVRKPGAYPLTKATGLIETISKAGGVSEEAGLELTVIRPRDKRAGGPIALEEAKSEELTVVDLKALLDGDLSKNLILKDGDTVYVHHELDKKVYMLGQVNRPGRYPLGRNSTVIEMISKAAGVTEDVGLDVMVVRPQERSRRGAPLRPEEARKEEISIIDLKALMDGDFTNNIPLKDEDTVFVTHKLDKKVYLLGQVKRPGKHPLGRQSTIIDMVSKAQGITDDAGTELVLVRPKPNRQTKGPLTPEQAGKDEITVLDLKALLDGDLSYNLPVQDEDTVFIPHQLTKKIYVVGALRRTGTFPLGRNSTLIEMLSKAEGLMEEAGEEAIVVRPLNRGKKEGPILPQEAGTGETMTVDLKAIQQGDLTKNILLQDGDTVFVPRAESFFVMGEVKKPGRYKLERGTTVLKAISTAGGFTDKAASKRTRVLREIGGVKEEVRIELNSPVQAQDTIIVPESFF